MDRRITLVSTLLLIAVALGFQLGRPKISGPVASAIGLDSAPVIANTTNLSIDTTPYWNGSDFVHFFGVPNTATYGQTISMTKDATLTRFSFFMELSPTMVFRGYVFGWDGSKATGTPLFQSAPMSATQSASFEEVVFNIPPGIGLNAGQQYVLFASTSTISQTDAAGRWGFVDNVYREGQFVFLNNGTDSSKWTSTTWSANVRDLAFKAIFAEVVVTPTVLTIGEPAGSGVFTISLSSQPTDTVTIPLTHTGECNAPASVDIPPLQWQAGITVTVSGVNNHNGPQLCQVQLLPVVSNDNHYLGFDPDDVAVTVINDYGISLPLIVKAVE